MPASLSLAWQTFISFHLFIRLLIYNKVSSHCKVLLLKISGFQWSRLTSMGNRSASLHHVSELCFQAPPLPPPLLRTRETGIWLIVEWRDLPNSWYPPSSPCRMKSYAYFSGENQPREICSYLSGKDQKAGFIASDKPKNHSNEGKVWKRSKSDERLLFSYISYFWGCFWTKKLFRVQEVYLRVTFSKIQPDI